MMYLIFALIILTTLIGFMNNQINISFTVIIVFLVCLALFLQKRKKSRTSEVKETVSSKTHSDLELQKNYIDLIEDLIIRINSFNIITLANNAAKTFYSPDIVGKNIISLIRTPELIDKIDNCRFSKKSQLIEFEQNIPIFQFFKVRISNLDEQSLLLVIKNYTEIKKAETLRTDFIANVSHQLKTPLVSIKGFLESLAGPAKDDEKVRYKFIKIMQEESNKMEDLIEDLMSLNRIESQSHIQPKDKVDIQLILKNLVESTAKVAEKKDITIELNMNHNNHYVLGDSIKISEVFQNILDNSIKYSDKNKKIYISTFVKKEILETETIVISIKDEGMGIPEEEIHRVTERFYRSQNAIKNKIKGTGLGLSIVKHIINQHRGDMQIFSKLGEGSEFIIYLLKY